MTNHAEDRLIQRILSKDSLNIVKETSTANYNKIGEFKLTDLIKEQIVSKVDEVHAKDFGNRKDYAVLIRNFGKVVSLHDSQGESNGDSLYAIVRGNNIATICFVKSYSGFSGLEQKLRVDAIIKNLNKFKK